MPKLNDTEPDLPPMFPPPATYRKPNRRYMSLNLRLGDYEIMAKLAEYEHCTVTEAIRRSVRTRWMIHGSLHPELRWPDMPPADLPEPERLAFVGVRTRKIREVEIEA